MINMYILIGDKVNGETKTYDNSRARRYKKL